MQNEKKIIEFLNRPGATSGSELGAELGVSRMAIQKRIQALVEHGLPVSAVRGVGYVLEDDVNLLEVDVITQNLGSAVRPWVGEIEVQQSIESTNSHLLSKPIELGKATVCLAETQSKGRGRRGNDWQSAPYRNIMLSVSWGFDHWPATITGLGLAVGLVVAEYLNLQYSAGVTIKWPNDLLVGNDKLGGILVDVAGESSGSCNVVIGLGLNVHQSNWSAESGYDWQDLAGLGVSVNRNTLAADLISVISAMLSQFSKDGFSVLTERWNALSSYADKKIRIIGPESDIVGVMRGVDETGALLIEVNGSIERIDDSSRSVRLVDL